MRYPSLLLLLLACPALAAQGVDPRTEALIERARRDEIPALNALAPITRDLVDRVGHERHDTALAHLAARAALAMVGPLSAPEATLTPRERVWRETAVKALRSSLAADSADAWSAQELEAVAPYPYLWTSPDAELALLRALAARRTELPADVRLTRLRLEIERGSLDSADALLTALPPSAAGPAVHDHLAAEVAFARGEDSIGRARYVDGAHAIADSLDAGWYTRDLLWIARPTELQEWGSLAPAMRGTWLEQFWQRRDLADARLPGSRLPEQFRRWRIALRDYRWEINGRTAEGAPIGDLQYPGVGDDFPPEASASAIAFAGHLAPGNRIIDDRGRMILRHGEPTRTANLPGLQHDDMATWSWAGPDGRILLGFSRPMIDSTVRRSYGMILRNRPMGDMMSVCQLDSRFCALAGSVVMGRNGRSASQVSDRARLMTADFSRMRNLAETTDGFRETYHDELHAITQAYGVAGGGVLVVVAVPVSRIKESARAPDGRHVYAARLRVVVGDSARGVIAATLDTVREWRLAQTPRSDGFLSAYMVVPAPTGLWQVSVVVADSARRAGTGERFTRVPVVAFDGTALRVSDPILGRENGGLSWPHDAQLVPLNPSGAWHRDEPATLSYEVDGMVVGRDYETRIELWDAAGTPAAARNVITFRETASGSRRAIRRDLALRELPPGDYRLVIRVHDTESGVEAQRTRLLAVRK